VRKITTFLAVGALLAACSSTSTPTPGGGGGSGDGNVTANLEEWHMALSTNTVPAGEVTFHINNNGEETHEFVVVSTDLAEDALPVVDDQIPEDSDQLTAIDEVEDIESGTQDATLTVNLDPGHYVIFCNLLAHYGKGMHATINVE
jgi:uncharacterized cupredoxin-like copper-binding protein